METVIKWTKNKDLPFQEDRRGWPKNKPRKYTHRQEKKILTLYHSLKNNPSHFFCGATAIANEWRSFYPCLKTPHLRFIGRVLKKHNLTQRIKKGRNKVTSRYLLYPDYTILNTIAKNSLLEIDFIGKKFIRGRTEPVNFLAFSLRGKRILKHYLRIENLTRDELITQLIYFFKDFEKPLSCKMDNSFVFFGPCSKRRFLSKVVLFLLSCNVIPIFTAPKRPWNQASVEGASSIFARKFWNKFEFNSLQEIDARLRDFNLNYLRYLNYQRPQKAEENPSFSYAVYFIRKVYEDENKSTGFIQIGDEKIEIPSSYINLFTLCHWDLERELLYIYLQKEKEPKDKESPFYLQTIKKTPFELNKVSEKKVVDFYLSLNRFKLSNCLVM